MFTRFTGLWRHSDFLKLWAGESISAFGTQVTMVALPLLAAVSLEATPMQMGVLGAVQYAPWLLFGLFAGVWVDRHRRRPVMMAADLGRGLLLGFIPIGAFLGLLRLEHLYIIGFLVGLSNVFFEVAYVAYLPTLIPPERLLEGNSKLLASASIAEIGGPGLAGGLIQLASAPFAILVNALSYLAAAVFLGVIRTHEPALQTRPERRHLRLELLEGLRLVVRHPILRAFVLTSATTNLFIDVNLAVYVLYLTRELGVPPAMVGLMQAISSLGTLAGSLLARRVTQRVGLGRVIIGAQLLAGLAVLTIPLAGRQLWTAVPIILLAQGVWGSSVVTYVINSLSLRQFVVPNALQGRVAGSIRCITFGVAPLGFMLGGALGERIGLQATLVVAGAGVLTGVIWLVLSPLPGMREHPAAAVAAHAS